MFLQWFWSSTESFPSNNKTQPMAISTALPVHRLDPQSFPVPIQDFQKYCVCTKNDWKGEGLHHSFAYNNSRKLTIYLCTISHAEPVSHLLSWKMCFHLPFLPVFTYTAHTENVCKWLVDPWARRLQWEAHLPTIKCSLILVESWVLTAPVLEVHFC